MADSRLQPTSVWKPISTESRKTKSLRLHCIISAFQECPFIQAVGQSVGHNKKWLTDFSFMATGSHVYPHYSHFQYEAQNQAELQPFLIVFSIFFLSLFFPCPSSLPILLLLLFCWLFLPFFFFLMNYNIHLNISVVPYLFWACVRILGTGTLVAIKS